MERRQIMKTLKFSTIPIGIIGGILAVTAGSFFEVRPPEAYGVCMACHARDVMNWIVNSVAQTHLTVAPASAVVPVLTPIGVLLGAAFSAKANREFRWRRDDGSLRSFLYGVLVMNFALLAGGCSIRLLLRTATGEALGILGLAGLAAGVFVGTLSLRWWAAR
jgi:hypothetical protein